MSVTTSAAHRQITAMRIAERRRRARQPTQPPELDSHSRWPYYLAALGILASAVAVLLS
jgi:hypothetical protein